MELSLNRFFKRQYSSLFRAIGGYFTPRQNNKNREQERSQVRDQVKSFLLESALEGCSGVHSFASISLEIQKSILINQKIGSIFVQALFAE